MVSRLVLGCGTVGQRVVERLYERDEPVLVITSDGAVVETLRDENVRAQEGDPTDQSVLDGLDAPDQVFVASDGASLNLRILDAVEAAFPNANTVSYLGVGPDDETRAALTNRADRIVDGGEATTGSIVDLVGTADAERGFALRRQLSNIDGTLAVVTHDNPDPDAIASGVALAEIAESIGVDAEVCYYGEISHQENRAMVNLLDLELRNLAPDDPLGDYDAFALVDHSRPGVNDGLPEELHVDVVIDHHPPRGPIPGEVCDLRPDAGSTSTILVEYVDRLGLDVRWQTATALLYGIRIDTKDFTREATPMDFQAAARLLPHVDTSILSRIERPTIDGETFDTVGRAIKNRIRDDSIVVASVGRISNRDALSQAAEQLLAMDGVDTTLVFGLIDEMVFVSGRSRASDVDLGETLRDAYEQIGSAGGHANMAGAQLEIGVLADTDDDEAVESIVDIVEEVLTDRFFEAIRTTPGTPSALYSGTSEWLFHPTEHGEDEPA